MKRLPTKPLLEKVKQARLSMPNDLLAQISNTLSGGDCNDQFVARSLNSAQDNFQGLLIQIQVLLKARAEQ